jgi:predicted adenine nucleotide alpha hydrolase (AANH) superfamily ATPase
MTEEKTSLILHTCCAPCVTYVGEVLKNDYTVITYFYNPNIHPIEEYERRRDELIEYGKKTGLSLIIEKPDFDEWFAAVSGLENEPERGNRCTLCFEIRLRKTAQYAKKNNIKIFTTALTISPHKNADQVNEVGKQIAKELGLQFLEADFKKDNGFRKSCEISRQLNLYRQNYCGCLYSQKKKQR